VKFVVHDKEVPPKRLEVTALVFLAFLLVQQDPNAAVGTPALDDQDAGLRLSQKSHILGMHILPNLAEIRLRVGVLRNLHRLHGDVWVQKVVVWLCVGDSTVVEAVQIHHLDKVARLESIAASRDAVSGTHAHFGKS
jgi:hypothetical protein